MNKDFYCSANNYYPSVDLPMCKSGTNCFTKCENYHRKHPTPEQYKEEYGEEVPDDMPVWVQYSIKLCQVDNCKIIKEWWSDFEWKVTEYKNAIKPFTKTEAPYHKYGIIVIACTPFDKPEKNWRPE